MALFGEHDEEIERRKKKLSETTAEVEGADRLLKTLRAQMNGEMSIDCLQNVMRDSPFSREQLEMCIHDADDPRLNDRSPKRAPVDATALSRRRADRRREAALDHIRLTGQTVGGEFDAQHLSDNRFHKGQLQITYKTGNVKPGTYTRYVSTEFGSVHNGTVGANWDCCSSFLPGHPQFCEQCNAHSQGCSLLGSSPEASYDQRAHSVSADEIAGALRTRSMSAGEITSTLAL